MNKLSDLTILKQLLKEKQNKLSTLKYEYEAIVEQEPYMRNRLKNRQYSIHKLAGEIKSIEKEIKTMESKHLQDSMEILRLSGFTTDSDCGEKVYTKGESTEDECKDGGEGSGIKGHITSRSGYKMEDPKDIEAAIKKVKASGHPDPYYLSGLERALEIAKQERGMKDDDATKMGSFEQLGQNHETEAMEPEKNPVQAQDGIRFVTWVKPSGLEYQIGDIIQFKGKNVKVTKITGNVVEAQVMDACTKDEEVGEKFKTVMEEFGKGELKSSSGETVTDPKQAKAIAYSEQREAKDADLTEFWTKEQAQYVVQHPKLFKPIVVELAKKYLAKYFRDAPYEATKDADPKVTEAKKLIDLFGGAM